MQLSPGSGLPTPIDTSAAPGERFHDGVVDFLRFLPHTARRFWALVLVLGVLVGLGTALLLLLLQAVQRLAWPFADTFLAGVEAAPRWRRIAVPVAAGLLVSLTALLGRRRLGGHGTSGIIEAIWIRSGRLRLTRALLRGVVSIISVGMGASLGREGALLQIGSATGSFLGTRLEVRTDRLRLLVACGAAAGIAAAYNVPIGGALFGLEVLLGSFALELLGPIVVACVTATVISRVLVANHPSYVIPRYELSSIDIVGACILGPLCGAASALYVRIIGATAGLFDRVPARWSFALPPPALLLLGVVSIWLPELLGNGYDTVDAALRNHLSLALLVALPLCKLAATALCSGAGVPGGLFTPSLFYGAILGGAYGHLVARLLPGCGAPGAYALLGMGAVLAGTTHASVSAVIIIFELTSDYGVILPLMLACVLSTVVSRRLEPDSLYTAPLTRRRLTLPEMPRPHWLRAGRVRAMIRPAPESILPSTPFQAVVMRLLELPPAHDLYVTDVDGAYLGVIVLDALKGHIGDRELLDMVTAADVMDQDLPPLTTDTSLADAIARFGETDLERLPVIEPDSRRLVGTVAKRDVLRAGVL